MDVIFSLFKPFLIKYTLLDYFLYSNYKIRLPFSYRVFRKSFVVSGGRINNILSLKISESNNRVSSEELNNLPNRSLNIISEKKNFLDQMNKNGFFVFKTRLNNKTLQKIKDQLESIEDEYLSPKGNYLPHSNNIKSNKLRKSSNNLWRNRYVSQFALNKEFIELADAYLETRPICDLIASWKSFPTENNFLRNKAAQMYHFDMDRIKFIKFFIYLTDVSEDTGPHCYIKSSHRNLPKNLRSDGRFDDQDIIAHYTKSNVIEICGKSGSIIAVDTRGLHKGKPLEKGERQLIQFEYTNSLYGNDQYEKINVSELSLNNLEKSLIGS